MKYTHKFVITATPDTPDNFVLATEYCLEFGWNPNTYQWEMLGDEGLHIASFGLENLVSDKDPSLHTALNHIIQDCCIVSSWLGEEDGARLEAWLALAETVVRQNPELEQYVDVLNPGPTVFDNDCESMQILSYGDETHYKWNIEAEVRFADGTTDVTFDGDDVAEITD